MKSCINHPTNEPILVLYKWQVDFCEGDRCAAALLSFFENQWNMLEDPDQWLTFIEFDFKIGTLLLCSGEKLRKALNLLQSKGVLEIKKASDDSEQFRFKPEVVCKWLKSRKAD